MVRSFFRRVRLVPSSGVPGGNPLPPITGVISISPATVISLTQGVAFSRTFTATGGYPPFTFTATGVPPGMTFANATLSGTPTKAQAFALTIRATDAIGLVGTLGFSGDTQAGLDTTPNAFSFTDATNVALGSTQTSNTITVGGINAPATMTVTGGVYYKNGGAASTTATTVVVGDTVAVGHTASSSNSTAVNTTLTIGGVSDTFTSTTVAVSSGLDTSITPPDFSFESVSAYPPALVFEPLNETIAVGDNLVIQYSASRTFSSPSAFTVPLTSGTLGSTENDYIASALATITSPTQTYFRDRIERGAAYSAWSTPHKHGDVTAPTLTVASTGTYAEGGPVAHGATVSEFSTFSLSGTDAGLLELVTASDGLSTTIRLTSNANANYATKSAYSFTLTATDDAGNVTSQSVLLSISTNQPLWSTATGTNKQANISFPSAGDYLTITGSDGDVWQGVRANMAGGNECQFEIEVLDAIPHLGFGICNTATDFSAFNVFPGKTDSNGFDFEIHGTYGITTFWNAGVAANPISGGPVQIGDIYTLRRSNTAGEVKVWRKRGGTETLLYTSSGFNPTGFNYAWVTLVNPGGGRVRAKFRAPFSHTLDSGFTNYA